MSQSEIEYLQDCVKNLADNSVIVEVGTLFGGSAAIICKARKEKKSRIFTIDSYEIPAVNLENTKLNLKNEGCEEVEVIKGFSVEMAKNWNIPIDCLFLDGDHSYESVKSDIDSWIPKVKIGGLVLFHDYSSWPGVTEAVDEVINEGLLRKDNLAGSLLLTYKL